VSIRRAAKIVEMSPAKTVLRLRKTSQRTLEKTDMMLDRITVAELQELLAGRPAGHVIDAGRRMLIGEFPGDPSG